MKKVLDLLCQRCPRMEEMLTSSPGGRLQAVLSHDEATAGNVLNPLLRKKILLFYVTFTALRPQAFAQQSLVDSKKFFLREFGLSPPLTLKARSACPNANYQSFRA